MEVSAGQCGFSPEGGGPPEVLQSCPRAAVSRPKCRPHRGKEPCLGIPGPWGLLGKGELGALLRRQGSSAIVSRCFNTKELFASPPARPTPCSEQPLLAWPPIAQALQAQWAGPPWPISGGSFLSWPSRWGAEKGSEGAMGYSSSLSQFLVDEAALPGWQVPSSPPSAWGWQGSHPTRPTQPGLPSTKKDPTPAPAHPCGHLTQAHPGVVPLPSGAAPACLWAQRMTFMSTRARSPVHGWCPVTLLGLLGMDTLSVDSKVTIL